MRSLIGEQIHLRDWRREDMEPLRRWYQPEHRWHKTDGPYYPKLTAAEVDAMVEKHLDAMTRMKDDDVRRSLAIADNATDTLLGQVTSYWIAKETDWLAQGIVIFDDAYWGRGIGYEALGLWCDYLWEARPILVRLDLRTWSGNHGMARLALKLGYREEARFRKARIVEGSYYDGLGFGVLRQEWEERYPNGFAAHLKGVKEDG